MFSCSSDSENEGVEAVQDFEPPVITLLGENPQVVFKDEAYEELGAIATDNVDGDISNSITISSNVNVAQTGTYNVIYNVVDSSNNSAVATRAVDVVEEIDPIVGTWTLINEEWVADGDWPSGQPRGCFMTSDAGSPDQFIFTENSVTKNVWECFQDGSLAVDLVVYGPIAWTNLGANSYSIDGEDFEVTFIENNQMETPFDDGNILQTWLRN
jgi:hypothetical protein